MLTVAETSNEDVVRRYVAAHAAQDVEALGELRHPDWTVAWPQSGERIRGHANERAMFAAYPGGQPNVQAKRVVGSEDRWVMTPLFTLQRVIGNGDQWWADGVITYPDGSTWCLAILLELRDGRIHRETDYFAEPFEAPEWRKPWVERMGS
jgi:ketosteroid isomerase-like protein